MASSESGPGTAAGLAGVDAVRSVREGLSREVSRVVSRVEGRDEPDPPLLLRRSRLVRSVRSVRSVRGLEWDVPALPRADSPYMRTTSGLVTKSSAGLAMVNAAPCRIFAVIWNCTPFSVGLFWG